MDYAFTASQSGLNRVTEIMVAKMQGQSNLDAINLTQQLKDDSDFGKALFDMFNPFS